MAWFGEEARRGPPLPSTYEEAINEILDLRRQLAVANERWAKAVEKQELIKRSLTGQMKGKNDGKE